MLTDLRPEDAFPRLREGLDLRSLDLSPTEMFVITRVDGRTSIEDLCLSTGLGEAETASILRGLVDKGVVVIADPAEAPGDADVAAARAGEATPGLPDERRSLIDETYARLSEMDLYDLLGCEPGADRGDLRRGYAARAKLFHPDRYFGADLGPYKARLERIFAQTSAAYEFLQDSARRAEDEREARVARRARRAEAGLREEERRAMEELASLDGDRAGRRAPRTPGPTRAGEPERAETPAMERPTRARSAPGSPHQEILRARRRESIERRRRLRTETLRDRARSFYEQAMGRLRTGDLEAALVSLRLAAAFDSDGRGYADLFAEIQQRVAAERTAHYVTRAEFEAAAGRDEAAAALWERAAAVRPRAVYHLRAAEAYLAAGDLPGAKRCAEVAAERAPEDVRARLVLARVHLAARRPRDARAELREVLRRDPQSRDARDLLRDLALHEPGERR